MDEINTMIMIHVKRSAASLDEVGSPRRLSRYARQGARCRAQPGTFHALAGFSSNDSSRLAAMAASLAPADAGILLGRKFAVPLVGVLVRSTYSNLRAVSPPDLRLLGKSRA